MKSGPIRVPIRNAAIALALATFATSCATTVTDIPYSDVELNRRIVDAGTGHAIPDAIVVFKWSQSEGDIGHGSRTFCVRVDMVRTDDDGRYRVPTWSGRGPMIAVIYKRGRTRIDNSEATRKGVDMMAPSANGDEERLRALERIYAPLNCPREEDRKLAALYEAMYEEAKATIRSPADEVAVEGALRIFESAMYGEAEADSRARERREQRSTQRR